MKKIQSIIFIVVLYALLLFDNVVFSDNITVNGKKLFIPEETFIISGITATDPAVVSLESNDFSVGDSIAFSVPEEQTLGPDIPRSFVVIQGTPVINGDTVSFKDEVGQVRHVDENYWTIGAKYLVNCTVTNWTGVNGIYLPYSVTSPSSYHLIFGNGEYQYRYTPVIYRRMGIYSYAGHTADVTVNFIKEILPVNGTPYQITAIDPGTGDITIDADFSGLAAPITTGEAFIYKRSNFVFLSDSGGVPPAESVILLESGDYLLLESGDYLLLE